MGEGIDLNLTGLLSADGSVTIERPNPETSNRTGGNLSVVGALRVRGERGCTPAPSTQLAIVFTVWVGSAWKAGPILVATCGLVRTWKLTRDHERDNAS